MWNQNDTTTCPRWVSRKLCSHSYPGPRPPISLAAEERHTVLKCLHTEVSHFTAIHILLDEANQLTSSACQAVGKCEQWVRKKILEKDNGSQR